MKVLLRGSNKYFLWFTSRTDKNILLFSLFCEVFAELIWHLAWTFESMLSYDSFLWLRFFTIAPVRWIACRVKTDCIHCMQIHKSDFIRPYQLHMNSELFLFRWCAITEKHAVTSYENRTFLECISYRISSYTFLILFFFDTCVQFMILFERIKSDNAIDVTMRFEFILFAYPNYWALFKECHQISQWNLMWSSIPLTCYNCNHYNYCCLNRIITKCVSSVHIVHPLSGSGMFDGMLIKW